VRGLLLDTHIWFWFLTGSTRLPSAIRDAIEGSRPSLWLSAISVWELAKLEEKGRIRVRGGARRWIESALKAMPVHEAPLSREIALLSTELDLDHQDPADRFLAATAIVHELRLATVDERLLAARVVPTM
jgi:PIN domain nuclease of toxin-antitoxin system